MTRIDAPWLSQPSTQAVFDALEAEGGEVLAVGGCVRNTLLGMPASDVDMATNLSPEAVIRLAQAAGLRAIPTGIDHGTVTIVSDKTPYEVTTFRRDVATDGRRAVVAFAETAEEDAHRRDFTINALYCDRFGNVRDYVSGLDDIAVPHLRFIDDAAMRIREDYLRILRYFRFYAWYGAASEGPDPEAMSAIVDGLDGLAQLSQERVTSELIKLLAAPDPGPACAVMIQCGAMARLLDGAQIAGLQRFLHLEGQFNQSIDAISRLVALAPGATIEGLRLSKAEMKRHRQLIDAVQGSQTAGALGYRLGATLGSHAFLLRAALLETPVTEAAVNSVMNGSETVFPIRASDLPAFRGAALGAELHRLEAEWIASDFTLSKAALLKDD